MKMKGSKLSILKSTWTKTNLSMGESNDGIRPGTNQNRRLENIETKMSQMQKYNDQNSI